MHRRAFLARSAGGLFGLGVVGLGYGRLEAQWVHVDRLTLAVPRLPDAFAGTTVAVLVDLHHSRFITRDYVETLVERTNALTPDLILLPGDFVHSHPQHRWVRPCLEALSRLRAPLGVFAVPGNHDHWDDVEVFRRTLSETPILDVTNTGRWVEKGSARIRVAGVDDLWMGEQDLGAALDGAGPRDCCLLLSHNPDYVEDLRDPRVGLVVSGHTHGGQVVIPGLGYPRLPSQYGTKYLHGLVRTPWTQVYVSRGLGTSGVPFRFRCRPEINLLSLVPS